MKFGLEHTETYRKLTFKNFNCSHFILESKIWSAMIKKRELLVIKFRVVYPKSFFF